MKRLSLALAAVAAATAPALAHEGAGPLVDAAWVIDHAGQDDVVVIDIRANVENTELGETPYIAHAVSAPYNTAGWRTQIDGVPGKIPSVDEIAALIESLGVDNDDHVVIVPWGTDSSEFGSATRVYWTFRYLGHDDVSILDGGWRQYQAAGGAHVAEPAKAETSRFEVALNEDLLATTEEVVAALDNGTALVDGRPVEQFRGEAKSGVAAAPGTIPGSVNLPHHEFYSGEYARFAQPETIRALAAAVDLGADEANITFCNTGHWASVAWFGISEVLGNPQTAMYDGSMAEWTQDPARPLEPPRASQ
ncbi:MULTISPECIES: sulfurtransferase [unclassified Roseitalea]|uniref:sulfurtransferase n=1 Tax=unclassified Roseitalea TaxID=2639107 RepID=UPI00273E4DBD|nr:MULTISPECIES: sulfurtransferase [unclassified Roseitalea]